MPVDRRPRALAAGPRRGRRTRPWRAARPPHRRWHRPRASRSAWILQYVPGRHPVGVRHAAATAERAKWADSDEWRSVAVGTRRALRPPDPDRGVVEHGAAVGVAGLGAGQRVDADAALEVLVRPDPLDDDHAALLARRAAGRGRRPAPRSLPSGTRSPSTTPSATQSSGFISAVGRRSRASEPGVSVKVELRNVRAGAATSRKGFSAVAWSITSKWSGSLGIFAPPAAEARPVRLEAELPVRPRKAVEEMGGLERERHVLTAPLDVGPGVPHAGALQGLVHDLPRGHPEARVLGARAGGRARRSRSGSRGTRPAARSPSASPGSRCARSPCRSRRARGTSWPGSTTSA